MGHKHSSLQQIVFEVSSKDQMSQPSENQRQIILGHSDSTHKEIQPVQLDPSDQGRAIQKEVGKDSRQPLPRSVRRKKQDGGGSWGHYEFCGALEHVRFEMPIRHLIGNVRQAIGYTKMELRKEEWDRNKISTVDI